MGRRAVVLGTFVALGGCNALTGASALEPVDDAPSVAPPHDGGTLQADSAADDGGSIVDGGEDAPADSGGSDAGATDATIDVAPCTPVSVGPRFGANAEGAVWSNDFGILVPGDGQYAHTNGGNEPMVVTDFGFSLPQSATIKGIKVEIARTASGTVIDSAVSLPKGSPKGNGVWPQGPLAGPYVTATYGGPNDTWGTSWSAAEINGADFGVLLDITGGGDGHADSLGVTVYYCP